jgi:hypothetical protein
MNIKIKGCSHPLIFSMATEAPVLVLVIFLMDRSISSFLITGSITDLKE